MTHGSPGAQGPQGPHGPHAQPRGLHALHARFGHRHPKHGLTLRRALFAASFFSILATALVVVVIIAVTSDDRAWWREMQRAQRFASNQLVAVWDDAGARNKLIHDVARDLEVQIEVRDNAGNVLVAAGPLGRCHPGAFDFDVVTPGKSPHGEDVNIKLGEVHACRPGERTPPWRGFLALAAGLLMLWTVAGFVARRAARPLTSLVDVTRRIGEGDLQARPHARHSVVEVRKLADAIGEMAERIEQQMKDQRALLAGASHELRTPLGHLRILVELLRANPSDKVVDDVEREVVEMDALVGKLLASARLDFSMADKREVDALDLARRALERVGEPATKLASGSDVQASTSFVGDPTLVLGALSNLLENARSHGVSVVKLTVDARADEIVFAVDDAGPGIAAEDEERVFEPFFHKDRRASSTSTGANGSLGLGLSLVKRIAEAHGGRAFAMTRAEGGGRVGFTVARMQA